MIECESENHQPHHFHHHHHSSQKANNNTSSNNNNNNKSELKNRIFNTLLSRFTSNNSGFIAPSNCNNSTGIDSSGNPSICGSSSGCTKKSDKHDAYLLGSNGVCSLQKFSDKRIADLIRESDTKANNLNSNNNMNATTTNNLKKPMTFR